MDHAPTRDVVERLWRVATAVRDAGAVTGSGTTSMPACLLPLSFAKYRAMHFNLFVAMNGPNADLQLAANHAKADWRMDTGGASSLSYQQFAAMMVSLGQQLAAAAQRATTTNAPHDRHSQPALSPDRVAHILQGVLQRLVHTNDDGESVWRLQLPADMPSAATPAPSHAVPKLTPHALHPSSRGAAAAASLSTWSATAAHPTGGRPTAAVAAPGAPMSARSAGGRSVGSIRRGVVRPRSPTSVAVLEEPPYFTPRDFRHPLSSQPRLVPQRQGGDPVGAEEEAAAGEEGEEEEGGGGGGPQDHPQWVTHQQEYLQELSAAATAAATAAAAASVEARADVGGAVASVSEYATTDREAKPPPPTPGAMSRSTIKGEVPGAVGVTAARIKLSSRLIGGGYKLPPAKPRQPMLCQQLSTQWKSHQHQQQQRLFPSPDAGLNPQLAHTMTLTTRAHLGFGLFEHGGGTTPVRPHTTPAVAPSSSSSAAMLSRTEYRGRGGCDDDGIPPRPLSAKECVVAVVVELLCCFVLFCFVCVCVKGGSGVVPHAGSGQEGRGGGCASRCGLGAKPCVLAVRWLLACLLVCLLVCLPARCDVCVADV